MSEWSRLKDWNVDLGAVVETTRDGYLVSIRYMRNGVPDDIVGWVRPLVGARKGGGAAVADGRTVEAAFRRAMHKAEVELDALSKRGR